MMKVGFKSVKVNCIFQNKEPYIFERDTTVQLCYGPVSTACHN